MTATSGATFGAPLQTETPFTTPELVLATIDRSDFRRAEAIITDFQWSTYDEFSCERDGLYIGLSSAGERLQLVSVSVRAFEWWALHSGTTPSIKALDEFAAEIYAYRSNPNLRVEGVLWADCNNKDNNFVQHDGRLAIQLAPVLYRNWLETLAPADIFPSVPSIDVYAQLLIEAWADL
jgi:hypothetical protein